MTRPTLENQKPSKTPMRITTVTTIHFDTSAKRFSSITFPKQRPMIAIITAVTTAIQMAPFVINSFFSISTKNWFFSKANSRYENRKNSTSYDRHNKVTNAVSVKYLSSVTPMTPKLAYYTSEIAHRIACYICRSFAFQIYSQG